MKDNEIQILGLPERAKKKKRIALTICLVLLLLLAIVVTCVLLLRKNDESIGIIDQNTTTIIDGDTDNKQQHSLLQDQNTYTEVREETINDVPMFIYIPNYREVELVLGRPKINDSTIIFAVQAADIAADMKTLVGDFVIKGKQLAKSKSKRGFCAIIGNEITIGLGVSTPLLQESIDKGGDFFRQYSLVSEGKIVEVVPKGKSIRRALGKLKGRDVIIESRSRESFHDFSQALIDIGIEDAIYLVGGNAFGWYLDKNGEIHTFGSSSQDNMDTGNYLIFKR